MPADLPARLYRGRFAPSPTGPLHLGSLVAALASHLDARAAGGQWLVRIEDLDKPREMPGARNGILRSLERLGLAWDGPVWVQSERLDRYEDWLAGLGDLAYPCGCSRRDLDPDSGRYPGTCRGGLAHGQPARSIRVRLPEGRFAFEDRIQGHIEQDVAAEVGDMVIRRADGPFAYQFAVVVDDAESGITDVVRGADLLDSTPRQLALHQCLGLTPPRYAHLPLVLGADGQKLSKQNLAPAIDERSGSEAIASALTLLGHPPPVELAGAPPAELITWATSAWAIARVPRQIALPAH
jgi:glutamyl-Q tRNA(Asp) synthetase